MNTRAIVLYATVLFAGLAITPLTSGFSSSDAVRLLRVPHGGIQPDVAVGDSGVLHALYFLGEPRAGDLFYVRSSDNGLTFSKPIRVNSQVASAIAAGTIRGGQLAIGRGSRVHVVWNGSDAARPRGGVNPATGRAGMPLLYARLTRGGTAFEPQRSLMRRTYNLDGGASVTADRSGNVMVAWHGNDAEGTESDEGSRRVWIAWSSDEGRTFAPESPAWTEPTGACGCCGMRMLAAANNTVYLLYRSAAGLVNRDLYLLTSNERRLFRGTRIHEWHVAACPMTSMSLVDANSRVHGAWETGGQVYFALLGRTGPIAGPFAPPGEARGRKHPRIAVNSTGQILLTWTEGASWARAGTLRWQVFDASGQAVGQSGGGEELPVWSFAAPVAHPDGKFTIFY